MTDPVNPIDGPSPSAPLSPLQQKKTPLHQTVSAQEAMKRAPSSSPAATPSPLEQAATKVRQKRNEALKTALINAGGQLYSTGRKTLKHLSQLDSFLEALPLPPAVLEKIQVVFTPILKITKASSLLYSIKTLVRGPFSLVKVAKTQILLKKQSASMKEKPIIDITVLDTKDLSDNNPINMMIKNHQQQEEKYSRQFEEKIPSLFSTIKNFDSLSESLKEAQKMEIHREFETLIDEETMVGLRLFELNQQPNDQALVKLKSAFSNWVSKQSSQEKHIQLLEKMDIMKESSLAEINTALATFKEISIKPQEISGEVKEKMRLQYVNFQSALQPLTRNAIKGMANVKHENERAFFRFKLTKTAVMVPIGMVTSAIGLAAFVTAVVGVSFIIPPLGMTIMGLSMTGLGIGFSLAGLAYGLYFKPQTSIQDTFHLRGLRKDFREIPVAWSEWQVEKAAFRITEIQQKIASLQLSENPFEVKKKTDELVMSWNKQQKKLDEARTLLEERKVKLQKHVKILRETEMEDLKKVLPELDLLFEKSEKITYLDVLAQISTEGTMDKETRECLEKLKGISSEQVGKDARLYYEEEEKNYFGGNLKKIVSVAAKAYGKGKTS